MNKPNILFIMCDDHAAHAMSCYNSKINMTPNIDRIANEGMRFDNCFCTNSICAPSRAVILTGVYNHLNGVKALKDNLDGRQQTVSKLLQAGEYQTAIVGKWHLGHGEPYDPTGFDYWNILPGQGAYFDPSMIEMGEKKEYKGYVTDVITDLSIDWIKSRDKSKPFFLMCHHKAPHQPWLYDEKHAHLYENEYIPEPETFNDDYATRAEAAMVATMRIDRDLTEKELKIAPPEGITPGERKSWNYQRFIKDYLRCVASVDDNVGQMLDVLEEEGVAEDTIVIYTSDQGFFLGDHGWFDKRFMYEESLRMPFIVRYPRKIMPGSVCDLMAVNIDFAPTFLDYAGLPIPENMQGESLRPLMEGERPIDWRTSMYYRYWMHLDEHHEVYAHYGIRSKRYKLIYYYAQALGTTGSKDIPKTPEWELFDMENDPNEVNNVYQDPNNASIIAELKEELHRLRVRYKDDDGV
jgi:arylsulfatase A-like enzyme